ncbi:MAG TPA: methyltransferase [Methylomirabilota bacterium]
MAALSRRVPAPWHAWLGGAVFVGSLGYFLYAYFVRMGRPAPVEASRVTAVLADVGLFSAFALHHSLLARSGAKRWLTARLDPRLERSLYVWISSVLFIAVCWLWQPLPGEVYRQAGPATVPHWMAVAGGVWLTLRSAGVIEPLELAGIRQAAGDLRPPAFKIHGPYHVVRHPIYLGWLLMVFGVPHMTWTRLLFATISSAYLVVAIRFEERSLLETFGEAYRAYQETVRWRMVPGIW